MKKSKSIFYNLYNVLRCKAYFDVMTPFSNAENNLIKFDQNYAIRNKKIVV